MELITKMFPISEKDLEPFDTRASSFFWGQDLRPKRDPKYNGLQEYQKSIGKQKKTVGGFSCVKPIVDHSEKTTKITRWKPN